MSCKKCEDEPFRTYIRIGNGDVEILGCEEHLRRLIRLVRLGIKYEGRGGRMREIKFRAWDNEKREFLSDDYGPISVGDSKVVTGGDWQGLYYTDKYTIEQYTGLKDKNGKEIYEGDILKCSFGESGVVEFRSGSYFVVGDDINEMSNWKETAFEIIGNIHENSELIEKEKE